MMAYQMTLYLHLPPPLFYWMAGFRIFPRAVLVACINTLQSCTHKYLANLERLQLTWLCSKLSRAGHVNGRLPEYDLICKGLPPPSC